MKNVKRYLGFVAIVALLFTSCTKDENNLPNTSDTELAKLSFAPLLADMENSRASSKQAEEIPGCSIAAPSYVEIILSQDGTDIVGSMGAPFALSLVANQLFTQEVPELELPPGTYSLDHFAVYDADDNLIWVAPKTGGDLANLVDDPLPIAINLGAGVKKYVDVTVLCFDDRDVNEYGYLFFELNPEVALEFCFFANYCDDDGRHYTGSYSVSIWKGTDNTGDLLYSDIPNVTGQYPAPDDDYYADPLCFALPSNEAMAEEYLYYEVTLLDWPEVYGTVSEPDITGTLSMNDIIANLSGDDEVEYEHLRFNCGQDDNGECDLDDPLQDCDNDGVLNGDDDCPTEVGTVANNGCPEAPCDLDDPLQDCDEDGVLNGVDACPGEDDSLDFDEDGIPDGCDPDDDGDGILDINENVGCSLNPDLNCGEVTIPDCTISERSGCIMGSTDGTLDGVLEGAFINIVDSGNASIAQGTIIIVDGKVNVSVSPVLETYISDYEIELQPIGVADSETICAEGLPVPESGDSGIQTVAFNFDPAATYSIRIKVNTCTR